MTSIAAILRKVWRRISVCLAREDHSDAGRVMIDLQGMRTDGKISVIRAAIFSAEQSLAVAPGAGVCHHRALPARIGR